MKIQTKKSNVLEGGAAKRPTPVNMKYGEIAINYNAADPTIFIKDSNNQIIEININKIGSIDSGSTPPGINNNIGDLYFDLSTNQLLFWNGSNWIPLNANLGYSTAPNGGTVTNTAGTDAQLPLVNAVNAGLMSPAEHQKLLSIVGVVLNSPSNGLSLVGGKLQADIATINSLGTVKVGSGLDITADGTLSVTIAQDFLTTVNLGYIQEVDHNIITNDAGNDARIELANTVVAGLMAPTTVQFINSISNKNFLEEVNLNYLPNGDNAATVTNTAGTGFQIPIATSVVAGLFTAAEKQKLAQLTVGGGGSGLDFVNLSYLESSDRGTIVNTGGDNAVIPLVNNLRAGLMSPGDFSKLDGIQPGAEANPDLTLYAKKSDPVSTFTNDAGYITSVTADGDYVKLNDSGNIQVLRSKGLAFSSDTQSSNANIVIDRTLGNGLIFNAGDLIIDGEINNIKFWRGPLNLSDLKNIGIGTGTLVSQSVNTSTNNIGLGEYALNLLSEGNSNVGIGTYALNKITTASNNVALGQGALREATTGDDNVAIGSRTMRDGIGEAQRCTALGSQVLMNFTPDLTIVDPAGVEVFTNTGVGFNALNKTTTGYANTAVGYKALEQNETGFHNVAIGDFALSQYTDEGATAVGLRALASCTTGTGNTAFGKNALAETTTGRQNVALGGGTLRRMSQGNGNTGVGFNALTFSSDTNCTDNTALGREAGKNTSYSNCTFLGAQAQAQGNNELILGTSSVTSYSYGQVGSRSDSRDKRDIRDTVLGLEFIKRLRPIDFRYDYRENYVDENGVAVAQDGSRAGTRYHHGFAAQEVKAAADAEGIDFAGYKDHSINGGNDVLSIAYGELIAPLVKAVQQLSAENADLKTRLETVESNTLQPLYNTLSDLPNASDHHGKTAHVHSEGALYFAHAGSWVKLQNA